jgi:hypothetical protein
MEIKMSYARAFKGQENITVSDHSPRRAGETEANSLWKEISIPEAYCYRVKLAQNYVGLGYQVWIKVATGYGHARMFIALAPRFAPHVDVKFTIKHGRDLRFYISGNGGQHYPFCNGYQSFEVALQKARSFFR